MEKPLNPAYPTSAAMAKLAHVIGERGTCTSLGPSAPSPKYPAPSLKYLLAPPPAALGRHAVASPPAAANPAPTGEHESPRARGELTLWRGRYQQERARKRRPRERGRCFQLVLGMGHAGGHQRYQGWPPPRPLVPSTHGTHRTVLQVCPGSKRRCSEGGAPYPVPSDFHGRRAKNRSHMVCAPV